MDEKYVVLQTTWKRMNPFLGLLRTEHALCGQWTATIHSSACQFALIRLQVPESEKLHIQFLISKSDSEKKKILLNKKNVKCPLSHICRILPGGSILRGCMLYITIFPSVLWKEVQF